MKVIITDIFYNETTEFQIKSEAQLMRYVWKLIKHRSEVTFDNQHCLIKAMLYTENNPVYDEVDYEVGIVILSETYDEWLYLKYIYYKYLHNVPKRTDIDDSRLFVSQVTEDDIQF